MTRLSDRASRYREQRERLDIRAIEDELARAGVSVVKERLERWAEQAVEDSHARPGGQPTRRRA